MSREDRDFVKMTIRINKEFNAELTKMCHERRIKKVDLVNELLREWMKQEKGE